MISSDNDDFLYQPSSMTTQALPLESPVPEMRTVVDVASPSSSTSSLPYRRPNPIVSSLYASTSTPGSRSVSPNGPNGLPRAGTESVFGGTPSGVVPQAAMPNKLDDPRNLISQAFVPHIAVYTSTDTDEILEEKGFAHGLWQLLRPYGERVQGKVIIRDSVGSSRTCDDFAVRFVQFQNGPYPSKASDGQKLHSEKSPPLRVQRASLDDPAKDAKPAISGGDIVAIEKLVGKHLAYAEQLPLDPSEDYMNFRDKKPSLDAHSPFHSLYLRRLLSAMPMEPHESFSHPVACIIAISSRNGNPIEALRGLYQETSHGSKRFPVWVYADYLRYYVLVHDEEKDDISKSMTLFEQMKRHFGLHCHLLRIRSSQCIITDDDAIEFPSSEWASAAEEINDIESKEMREDVDNPSLCIYDSDATAVRTFIREMVTQSVVPSMERCISTWNDQVASRRRGLSGRFMSLSKKWTGFGSSSRTSTAATGPAAGPNSNYDTLQGFYQPDTPEALMRKLGDYAFMLRDWKLAQSTYDLCRSDYNNDKAWKYHAAANEMATISVLMATAAMTSKARAETVDQMLEAATYNYITRCNAHYSALRCLVLGMELLSLRDGSATDDAARWGARLLEAKLVGSVGDALIKERIASYHARRKGKGSGGWGSRTRKAALWKVLAAHSWLEMGIYVQAESRMREVKALYGTLSNHDSISQFQDAQAFLMGIERQTHTKNSAQADGDTPEGHEVSAQVEEESESFDTRGHRRSRMGLSGPNITKLRSATSQPDPASYEDHRRDDNFE